MAYKIKNNHNSLNHTENLITCKNVDHSSTAIVDSGTTGNYLTATSPCVHKTSMQYPIQLHMPNGEIITSSHKELLPMTQVPIKAREAIVSPKLRKALLSVSTLCNNGCTATFDKQKIYIYHNVKIIMQGTRQKSKL